MHRCSDDAAVMDGPSGELFWEPPLTDVPPRLVAIVNRHLRAQLLEVAMHAVSISTLISARRAPAVLARCSDAGSASARPGAGSGADFQQIGPWQRRQQLLQ